MSYGLGADVREAAPAKWSWTVDLPVEQVTEGVEAAVSAAKEDVPARMKNVANQAIGTLFKGAIAAGLLVTAAFFGYKYMTRQS